MGVDYDSRKKFAELLETGLLEWDQQEGRRHTITEYAKRVGVTQAMMSRFMAGKAPYAPDTRTLMIYAQTFGQVVYDIWGIEIPISDPVLKAIYERWQTLPQDTREEIYRIVTREEPPD